MSDPASTTVIAGDVVSRVFTGTSADSVIAILLVIVCGLCFLVWVLTKRLDEKDKILTETVENSNKELRNLAGRYMDNMDNYHQQSVNQSRIVNESITGTRILLSEIKGLLTLLTSRNDK